MVMNVISEVALVVGYITISILLVATSVVLFVKFLDKLSDLFKYFGHADLSIRLWLWRNHVWGGLKDSEIKAAKNMAEWEDVEEELEPIFEYYESK